MTSRQVPGLQLRQSVDPCRLGRHWQPTGPNKRDCHGEAKGFSGCCRRKHPSNAASEAFRTGSKASMSHGHDALSILPTHSPKPTFCPSSPQDPLRVTTSPSLRNLRVSIPLSWMSILPPSLISSRLPLSPSPIPLIVPEPSRSPVLSGHPPIVWCVTICPKDHSRFRELTRPMVVVDPPPGANPRRQ